MSTPTTPQPQAQQTPRTSLAERCYDAGNAEMKLFERLHLILGGEPIEKCADKGFVWRCGDCWTDSYDSSVEVVLPHGQEPITKEQADEIIALGFGQIYESPTGVCWNTRGRHGCSVREGDEDRSQLLKARLTIATAQARIAALEKALQDILDDVGEHIDLGQGLRIERIFPAQFKAGWSALAPAKEGV